MRMVMPRLNTVAGLRWGSAGRLVELLQREDPGPWAVGAVRYSAATSSLFLRRSSDSGLGRAKRYPCPIRMPKESR